MAGIFISYRRDDAQGEALHLFDNLKQHFGADRVFMDVIAIRPGEDYRKVIDSAVASCDVLITLIGRDWLTSTTAAGQARINDARDFVRLETAAALKRDVRVIPVLVHGATMPTEEVLPDELKPLAYRNAIEVSHSRWDYDVRMLIDALERVLPPAAPAPGPPPSPTPAPPTAWRPIAQRAAVGAVVALLIGGAGYWFSHAPAKRGSVSGDPAKPTKAELTKTATTRRDPPGSVIDVQVAVADLRIVPDLVGKRLTEVGDPLVKAGMNLGAAVKEPTNDYRPGIVLRQEPAAGARVSPGTNVTVTFSVAMPIEVPKVVGLTRAEANDRLSKANLYVKWETAPSKQYKPGIVAAQNPEPGVPVAAKFAVTLTVAVSDGSASGTCIEGFVWREAFPGDRVCVAPKTRDQAAIDNKQAKARLEPNASKRLYGPDTCAQGYVWREANTTDHVCVVPDVRTRAAEDNKLAASRIAR